MDRKLSEDGINPKGLYDSHYDIDHNLGFCHKKPDEAIAVYKYPDKGYSYDEYNIRLSPVVTISDSEDRIVPTEIENYSNQSNLVLMSLRPKLVYEIPHGVKNYFVQNFVDGRVVIITDIPLSMIKPFDYENDVRLFGIRLSGPDYASKFLIKEPTFIPFKDCFTLTGLQFEMTVLDDKSDVIFPKLWVLPNIHPSMYSQIPMIIGSITKEHFVYNDLSIRFGLIYNIINGNWKKNPVNFEDDPNFLDDSFEDSDEFEDY